MLKKGLEKLREDIPESLHDFVIVFEAFDLVWPSCFCKELIPTSKTEIIHFGDLYCNLKTFEDKAVEIIPKIYILLYHVPDFCESNNCALGFFNEHASEHVHKLKIMQGSWIEFVFKGLLLYTEA